MSIAVPGSTSGSMISEYAANNISINRNMVTDAKGFLESVFMANINYTRKDYIVDTNGNKIGIVSKQENGMMNTDPTYSGNIYLDQTTFNQYFSVIANQGDIVGNLVANIADTLIHQDLIKRGILTA